MMRSRNLLEVVRRKDSVRGWQILTTDKGSEIHGQVYAYRETDALGGNDPYSVSKACAELVAAAYRGSYFTGSAQRPVNIATVRAGNVIGGGDWARDRIVPDCIRTLRVNDRITIRRPAAVRPWQHVLEPLSGYLMLARRQATDPRDGSGAWNFGPANGGAMSVEVLVRELIRCWGGGQWAAQEDRAAGHEADWLQLDCTKAHTLLDWSPVLSFFEAVAWSTHWYKTVWKHPELAYPTVSRQIDDYCRLAARYGRNWAVAEAA